MATLITPLSTPLFPCAAATLTFNAGDAPSFAVRLVLDTDTLTETTLTPDADGLASLYRVDGLLNDHLQDGRPRDLHILLDGLQVWTGTVIPCRLTVEEEAPDFVGRSFLTVLQGPKLTHPEADEYLSWYEPAGEGTAGSLKSLWCTDGGQVRQSVHGFSAPGAQDGIRSVDVSPRTVPPPSPEARLVAYTVAVGRRSQTFRMVQDGVAVHGPATAIEFGNAFGQLETYPFFGAVERELKPTYTVGVAGGAYRNYDIRATPTWKAHTGPVPDSMLPLLDDLVTARRLWRAEDGSELAVTDCELKSTTRPDAPQQYTVTWRTCREGRTLRPERPERTFDDTFDKTYY